MPSLMKLCCAPLFLLFAISLTARAQTPSAPETRSAPAPIISPEINKDDHSVTFRLKAPNAKSVTLRGQWDKSPLPLTRAEDGIWSGSFPSVPPGVWEYSFEADGLSLLDPGNPAIKPSREPRSSILHIPSSPPAAWDFQDVPHGTVHQHTYFSKALGRPRELVVYTPPTLVRGSTDPLPLLVLQHGSGDNQQTWVTHGKAHWILDHLIATGKARPMIVLMLDGHPLGKTSPQDPNRRAAALEAFRRELFEDALPLVETQYPVAKEASKRAIAGLSMGGGQALSIGLSHLDRFAWIGAFSAGPADEKVTAPLLADVASTNAKLRLLWIGCGVDDRALQRNEAFIAQLKTGGIQHEWHATPGAHTWPIWRTYLADFLPRLFQESP
ncbi:esterase [Verrucomicrobium sp. BvORR034]|uniref:esterase n=1 Tax=Verrucomicrobium sp. BvORR034 TaxID=1396418 RepID=UPI000679AE4A|nr:esterase [Verrucomicrobium sp. BvORR034]